MATKQQPTESLETTSSWPESPPPHPENLALASKLCAELLPIDLRTNITTTHLPTGWSSKDVIRVSAATDSDPHHFIVKLPSHQISSHITPTCKAEALRTNWAAKHDFGPKVLAIDDKSGSFVMECIEGQTMTAEMTKQRLPSVMGMLRRIHGAKAEDWMGKYDAITTVICYLKRAEACGGIKKRDARLINNIILDTPFYVKNHPWTPCHNDFHSQNIILRRDGEDGGDDSLVAIDFEDCDLGDPMWDLAYLTVNLEMEFDSGLLERLYGVSDDERQRLRAYIPLAMAHCATWAAFHGEVWAQHYEDVMWRLRKAVSHFW